MEFIRQRFEFIIVIILILFPNVRMLASQIKNDRITVLVKVCDELTRHNIIKPSVNVFRINNDGKDSVEVEYMSLLSNEGLLKQLSFEFEPGVYSLIFSCPDGQTDSNLTKEASFRLKTQGAFSAKSVKLDVTETKKNRIDIGTVYLSRERMEVKLDEVGVTATKVMFYHKGDTLIYNADAFVLSEGSTLDALLKQMPGVKLNKDGVITVNGRRVENLLINGKDLFDGQNKLMIRNLAVYMIKDIKVYNKKGRTSQLMNRNMKDYEFTMDVRLKRDYATGWTVNADAGYGSHNRYAEKVFGMMFSENVSLSANMNLNNLNNDDIPGEEEDPSDPSLQPNGVRNRKSGGVTYLINGKEDKLEIKGSLNAESSKTNLSTYSQTTNYLTNGDTYRYDWDESRSRLWNVSTKHDAFFKIGNKINLTLNPTFTYGKSNDSKNGLEALFDSQIDGLTKRDVYNIYDGGISADSMVNRRISEYSSSGTNLNATFTAKADIRLGNTGKLLTLTGNGTYGRRKSDVFNRFWLDFREEPCQQQKQYQYTKGVPSQDRAGALSAIYNDVISGDIQWKVVYCYKIDNRKRTRELYQLEKLASDLEFGVLPSEKEYSQYINAGQSYNTDTHEHNHKITPSVAATINAGKLPLNLNLEVPLEFNDRTLTYNPRAGSVSKIYRNNFAPSLNMSVTSSIGRANVQLGTMSTPIWQNLLSMVDMEDNADPLNVSDGNEKLKAARVNAIWGFATITSKNYKNTNSIVFKVRNISNGFAKGAVTNPMTGVTHYRTYNVTGNVNADIGHTLSLMLGKRLRMTAKTTGEYLRSVDMAGTCDTSFAITPPRRVMNGYAVGENISLTMQTGRHSVTTLTDLRMNRYESGDAGFEDFTSWTGRFGASGVLNLPRNWGVSTDLTLYIRRGFTDQRLNTQDLVWNARVTKSLLKGSVVVAVDGYDLLRQLTNITYTINAQARTETVSNVIPAYVLVHVQWRWNKQPKR